MTIHPVKRHVKLCYLTDEDHTIYFTIKQSHWRTLEKRNYYRKPSPVSPSPLLKSGQGLNVEKEKVEVEVEVEMEGYDWRERRRERFVWLFTTPFRITCESED